MSKPELSNRIASLVLHGWGKSLKLLLVTLVIVCGSYWQRERGQTQVIPSYVLPDDTYSEDIYQLAQSTTVRLLRDSASGSGVIIDRQGEIYTVLTNWHVVETDGVSVLAADGEAYSLLQPPQQLGDLDLALVRFRSGYQYRVATIASEAARVGEKVYVAGFPLYQTDSTSDTISLGVQPFRLTKGEVSLISPKSLPKGYHLGYTNETQIGMSGGPIFNDRGLLIGVHGRGKHRDPNFGVYAFDDGSEPNPELLEKMIDSSWGISIERYLQFASSAVPK